MVIPSQEEFDELSVDEKILLVQDMWDRIAAHPEQLEVTDAQREELDRRLEAHRECPSDTSSWDVVRERVRKSR